MTGITGRTFTTAWTPSQTKLTLISSIAKRSAADQPGSGERYDHAIHIQPTHRQSSMVDERLSRNPTARVEFAISYEDDHQESDSTGTGRGQPGHEVKVSEGNCEPSGNLGISGTARKQLRHVPRIYKKWERLIQEEATAEALPKHQPWDHEIRLEPGQQPTFGPIYALSEKELATLREYQAGNERKGFIGKS
jgi:hypothetical protein